MTHAQQLIRTHELSQYRNGPAPITLAGYRPQCEDGGDVADCINASCRWSSRCLIDHRDHSYRPN